MTEIDFLNLSFTKNLLLFDIYDVDEFVLNEFVKIKNNNLLDLLGIGEIKRSSYELVIVGEDEYEKLEISLEDYLYRKSLGDNSCYTILNYDDFELDPLLEHISNFYNDEWLYDYQYNDGFLKSSIDWINKTEGDASKKIKIRELMSILKNTQCSLNGIKFSQNKNRPLNKIQKAVIQVFTNFDTVMLEGLNNYYLDAFPELFETPKLKFEVNDDKNPFPRIFTDLKAYDLFYRLNEVLCTDIRTQLADYSFVYRILSRDNYIYGAVLESEFRIFLDENYDVFLDKLKTLNNCKTNKKQSIYNSLK